MKTLHWHEDDLGFYSVAVDGTVQDFKLEERDSMKLPLTTLTNFKPASIIGVQNNCLLFGGKIIDQQTEENKVYLKLIKVYFASEFAVISTTQRQE